MPLSIQLNPALKYSVAVIMLLLLVWQLPGLYTTAHGNIQYYVAADKLDKWQAGKEQDLATYQLAKQAASIALSSKPDSAHYMLTLAKVMEWGIYLGFEVKQLDSLLPLYENAIQLRPDWPNAYSDYGYALAFIGNDLPGAITQLKRAEQYGPFIPEVLHQQLTVGLANWGSLPIADKIWLLSIVGRAAESHWPTFKALRELTAQYQRQDIVCPYLLNKTPALEQSRIKNLTWLCAQRAAS